MREKYLEQFYEYKNYSTGPDSLHTDKMNVDQVLKFINSVHEGNCMKYALILNKLIHPIILHLNLSFVLEFTDTRWSNYD